MNKKELLKKIQKEGDFKVFIYRDYLCIIKRQGFMISGELFGQGHLCGYVVIKHTDNCYNSSDFDADIHGGITYNGLLDEADGQIVVGFDCVHYGDINPLLYIRGYFIKEDATYKDMDFVKKELYKLVNLIIEDNANTTTEEKSLESKEE